MDNNISISAAPNESRRSKRGSFNRHSKNNLLLSTQVIPEISHESQDDDKIVLNNGHHADCNINRHLRFEQEKENSSTAPTLPPSKFPTSRVISVIEEASV